MYNLSTLFLHHQIASVFKSKLTRGALTGKLVGATRDQRQVQRLAKHLDVALRYKSVHDIQQPIGVQRCDDIFEQVLVPHVLPLGLSAHAQHGGVT